MTLSTSRSRVPIYQYVTPVVTLLTYSQQGCAQTETKSDRCIFEKERSNMTNTILYVVIANVCYVGNNHHT